MTKDSERGLLCYYRSMKLLLTSAGLRNQDLASALVELVGKPAGETKVGFIPTAENVEHGSKDFLLSQYDSLRRYDYNWIDVIDPSAEGTNWQERLEAVDVIFVSGGNTFYLLEQARRTGFGEWLKQNVGDKVYVGVSAGSIIVTPSIAIASIDDGDENNVGLTDLAGLSFVDFEVSPHTPEWVSYEANQDYAKSTTNVLHLIDDETGLKVTNGSVVVVGAGNHRII